MKNIDVKNDIVLTPDYVADLMCKLACVDNTSIVADNAAGAGALLSAAYRHGASDIVGVELSDMMFPILEHTLKETDIACDKLKLVHGDGLSDNLDFSNVTVALSNPPYSMPGKGLCFALNVMKQMKKGRVVVLIQDTAGNGQGDGYCAEMLHYGRLLYSIKMPDVFKGFASVQTAIYVFEVGQPHSENDVVKFVDFTKDGYTRSGRKSQKGTVKDTDNAKERYDELLNVLLNDAEPEYFKDDYIEEKITLSGDDWNYSSHKKIDTTPTLDDFMNTVKDYMEWKSSQHVSKLIGTYVKGDPNSMICTRYLLALGIDPRQDVETICKEV